MKKQYAASRSGLFLIELILSIFFFIIAAAVVMQLFVKSHFISEDTININHALLYTQNISEIFLAANGDFDAVEQAFLPETLLISENGDGASATLYFDKDWQRQATPTDAVYTINFNYDKATENDPYARLDIYVNKRPANYETLIDYDYTLDYIHHQEIKKYTGGHING